MKLGYKILGAAGLLVAVFLYGRCGRTPSPSPAHTVLPSGDKEQVLVDPVHHTLTILIPGSHIVTTLPDRLSTMDIRKDGTVKVTAQQLGFETRPFIGIGLGNGVRAYFGADLWYFKKLDVGLAGVTPKLSYPELTDTRLGAFVSYTVYSNTRISAGYDTSKTVHLLLSVRL